MRLTQSMYVSACPIGQCPHHANMCYKASLDKTSLPIRGELPHHWSMWPLPPHPGKKSRLYLGNIPARFQTATYLVRQNLSVTKNTNFGILWNRPPISSNLVKWISINCRGANFNNNPRMHKIVKITFNQSCTNLMSCETNDWTCPKYLSKTYSWQDSKFDRIFHVDAGIDNTPSVSRPKGKIQ